jgi:hypothetical protein
MAKNEKKHKSKYTKPKNFEASQKIAARKDLKDYTGDEAHGMVPGLVKGIQELVPRNINGEVIDDIENMVPKIKERLYKKVEEGDYSPEHARKVFEKLQIEDTEGYLEAMEKGVYKIKESISKLTESQKEKLVRMYIRNKIVKVLKEQGDPTADPTAELPTDPTMPPAGAPGPDDTAASAPTPAPEENTQETSSQKAEAAGKTFTNALDGVYLESITLGVEAALQPLINQYKKNQDQKQSAALAIYTTLANANIKYVKPTTTDHTKDDQPIQDIPTTDTSDLA